MPSATAILDRFLHHAEILTIAGKSYRLRGKAAAEASTNESSEREPKPAILTTGSTRKKRAKTEKSSAAETAT